MRNFTILFLFIGFSVFAQDCEKLINKKTDAVTGIETIKSKTTFTKKDKTSGKLISFWIQNNSYSANIYFVILNECIDEKNTVFYLFEDETRYRSINFFKFNCDGIFQDTLLKIIPDEDLYKNILTKNIKTIRVYTHSNSFEFDLSKSEADEFRDILNCIYKIPSE